MGHKATNANDTSQVGHYTSCFAMCDIFYSMMSNRCKANASLRPMSWSPTCNDYRDIALSKHREQVTHITGSLLSKFHDMSCHSSYNLSDILIQGCTEYNVGELIKVSRDAERLIRLT